MMSPLFRSSAQTTSLLNSLLDRPAEWRYGYDLSRETGLKSGTLYPILMRLSERGWLESRWEETKGEGRPPRHMYRLTGDGCRWAREQVSVKPALSSKLRPSYERGDA